MSAYVELENVRKVYKMGEVEIEALKDATFEIEKGADSAGIRGAEELPPDGGQLRKDHVEHCVLPGGPLRRLLLCGKL